MHKTGETLPPIINPLQVAGGWGGCHSLPAALHPPSTGCIRSMYGVPRISYISRDIGEILSELGR